jgi:hypothetical protein
MPQWWIARKELASGKEASNDQDGTEPDVVMT